MLDYSLAYSSGLTLVHVPREKIDADIASPQKLYGVSRGQLEFGKHLNIIVGENGSGKTHVLKAAYCALAVSANGAKDSGGGNPTKSYLQTAVANKLRGVFKPDAIGRLARRQAGRNRSEVECYFDEAQFDLGYSFNTSNKSEVVIEQTPSAWISEVPIYLPTRELLTIFPGFVSLYETTYLQLEETWRDTAILLGAPLARGARTRKICDLLEPLEEAMEWYRRIGRFRPLLFTNEKLDG